MSSRTGVRIGSQTPALLHLPDGRHDAGRADDLLTVAELAELRPDPWQELCLVESAWMRSDGRWSASEVLVEVPRQNGKGDIKLVRQLTGLFVWREWLQVHTAHEFKTCYEHFRKIVDIVENIPEFTRLLKPRTGIRTGAGDQAIELRTGERIRFIARSGGSGRGMTGDVVYLDEAFDLTPAMMGALQYTLRAVPNPQVWFTSSAAHAHSEVLHGIHNRATLTTENEPRLLALVWGNLPGVDPGDREAWYRANPAMGIRVDAETMANEYRSALVSPALMTEFRREALGIPEQRGGEDAIPPVAWQAVCSDAAEPHGTLALAFDVTPDRAWSSVSLAGGGVVELFEHRPGTSWLVERVAELAVKAKAPVAFQKGTPAASFAGELERRKVRLVPLSSDEAAQACGRFYDDVADQQVLVRSHPDLDEAVKAGAKAPTGDGAWKWSRKDATADVSPLYAVTLAHWAARGTKRGGRPLVAYA